MVPPLASSHSCSPGPAVGGGGGLAPFGSPALAALWCSAKAEAAGLPILFAEGAGLPGYDAQALLRHAVFYRSCGGFYIGATLSPSWRWLGGPSPRGWVCGHARGFDEMLVVDLHRAGEGSAAETRLIKYGQEMLHDCLNLASDARGQVRWQPNFLYVVYRRRDPLVSTTL